jgi:hypothetical protein
MKDIRALDILLYLLLGVKIIWIIVAILWSLIHIFDTEQQFKTTHNILKKLEMSIHIIFSLFLAILLIWLFNHLSPKKVCIDSHTKFTLYILGIMMLLTSLKNIYKEYILSRSEQHTKYWEEIDEILG